jgi:hypothetical protein
MTIIEAVGLIAGLITVFETGYLVGSRRRRKGASAAEDELVANRLKQILGSVRIRRLEPGAHRIAPGHTLPIALTITSQAACAFEVWIGASLVHLSGREHYDTGQDKPVMLAPGTNTYNRALTVPFDVAQGDYSLVVALWLGKPGKPDHSIRLVGCRHDEVVKVCSN